MPTVEIPASVEALLQKMVSFNTVNTAVSGDALAEQKLSEYLESLAIAMGFRTRRLPVAGRGFNLLVTHEVEANRPWLVFESHLDTTSVEGMTIDPFAARVEGGRLWGRGACDTKGTGAAMLWALHELRRGIGARGQPGSAPSNVAILFTLDEESGMTGIRSFVTSDLRGLGFKPRGVIVGEPTLLRPVVAHNGAARLCISTAGIAAHSADPSRGRCAITDMFTVVAAIRQRYIQSLTGRHPLTGRAVASVNIIRGGTQVNIIPAHCEVHMDRRVLPGEDCGAVAGAIEGILEDLRRQDAGLHVRQDVTFSCPPLSDANNGALLRSVQVALRSLLLPTQAVGAPYATDAGELDAAGVPALVIGPGDIAQAHSKDEFIELDQLHKGVELYAALMRMAE